MKESKKKISNLAIIALIIVLACITSILFSGIGYQKGWWHYSTGFTITEWSIYLSVLSLLVSIISLLLIRKNKTITGAKYSWLAILLCVPILGFAVFWEYSASYYPPINDVSTNTDEPPSFWDTPNPVDYPGEKFAVLQHKAYPEIHSIKLSIKPEQAFKKVLDIIKNNNWEIVSTDKEEGRVEATASSLLYGFKDDVVIQIQTGDDEQGIIIDIRSHSRIGRIDRGVNAKRISKLIQQLES